MLLVVELFKMRKIEYVECADHAGEARVGFGLDFTQCLFKGFVLVNFVVKADDGCKEFIHTPRPSITQRNHPFQLCFWRFHVAE